MKILLDCDQVVCDFLTPLLTKLSKHPGCRTFKVEDLTCWDILENQFNYWERSVANHFMTDGSFWSSLPEVDGAHASIQLLKDAGHEIVFCTAPYIDCTEWAYRREQWLMSRFNTSRDNIIITHGKHHIRSDIFIDDKPSNIEAWQKSNPYGCSYLFKYNYNKSSKLKGFSSWKQIMAGLELDH